MTCTHLLTPGKARLMLLEAKSLYTLSVLATDTITSTTLGELAYGNYIANDILADARCKKGTEPLIQQAKSAIQEALSLYSTKVQGRITEPWVGYAFDCWRLEQAKRIKDKGN